MIPINKIKHQMNSETSTAVVGACAELVSGCSHRQHKTWNMFLLLIFLAVSISSCKKLVETPPPFEKVAETNAFSTDATAIAVLNGMYILMNEAYGPQPIQGKWSISLFAGLSADELTLYNGVMDNNYLHYYQNVLSPLLRTGSEHWAPLYNYIFKCNAAIEALTSSKANPLTPSVRKQLLGEAQFLRGFFYFYLVNLFGDLPLCLKTDPDVNVHLSRSPKATVYQQIITDLLAAEENISAIYLNGDLTGTTSERVRPTKWAASALLARAYLYTGDYANAETKATAIINNTDLFDLLPSLNDVFLKNSREAIWQIQPTDINFNTVDARTYVLPVTGPDIYDHPVYLSDNLLNSFEPGDLRANPKNWVDTITVAGTLYTYPFKYKLDQYDPNVTSTTGTTNMNEYFMMLRLGEVYLIRAEARAQLIKIGEAQNDLNAIRNRAGLVNTLASDKASLLTAILHERQVELFSEWGHRWLDLKRTGKIAEVMNIVTPQKSNGATSWQTYQQLYPLPLYDDILVAPNLVQNLGYH